jgi:hypothetical protein
MYLYPILVGYVDTNTQIHHFSGISFDNVRIRVSDTYCIGYPYPYSCNTAAGADLRLRLLQSTSDCRTSEL